MGDGSLLGRGKQVKFFLYALGILHNTQIPCGIPCFQISESYELELMLALDETV
jgi:hypothetical protein